MTRRPGSPGLAGAAPIALLLLFAAVVGTLIGVDAGGTSEAADEARYHLPTVQLLAERGLDFDDSDYASATAPGLHLVLAGCVRAGVTDVRGLRAIAAVASLGLLAVVLLGAVRAAGPAIGALLVLPFAASSYVIGSAVWITTDNAALAFVWTALAAALAAVRASGDGAARRATGWLIAGGLAAAGAVAVRQIHVWSVGPVIVAALLVTPWGHRGRQWIGARVAPERGAPADAAERPAMLRPSSTLAILPAILAPFALLATFVMLWGGLVPPGFSGYHEQGIRFASPVLTLALLGAFGVWWMPAIVGGRTWPIAIGRMLRTPGPWLAAGVVLALSLVPATDFDRSAGRWGGAIWELVRLLPAPGGRSPVLVLGAAAGAWVLAHGLQRLVRDGRLAEALLWLTALGAWMAAQSFNAQVWQRYAEPMLLAGLAWVTARCVGRGLAGAGAGAGVGAGRRSGGGDGGVGDRGVDSDGGRGGGNGDGNGPTHERDSAASVTPDGAGSVPPGWWIGPLLVGVVQIGLDVVTIAGAMADAG